MHMCMCICTCGYACASECRERPGRTALRVRACATLAIFHSLLAVYIMNINAMISYNKYAFNDFSDAICRSFACVFVWGYIYLFVCVCIHIRLCV